MSLVASETKVESAPPATRKKAEEWLKMILPIVDGGGTFENECLLDIMKMVVHRCPIKDVPMPSLPNVICAAKDELDQDPYNLRLINNLAALYSEAGLHTNCLNTLLRGWKRAGEITDEIARFGFLMKASSLSMLLHKYKQARAIFQDIPEPADAKALQCYQLLGTQVWACSGDTTQSLKLFQKVISGMPYDKAVRYLASVAFELNKAGALETAASSVQKLSEAEGGGNAEVDIRTITEFIHNVSSQKVPVSEEVVKFRFQVATGVVIFMFLIMVLYVLESRSFAAIKNK